MSASTPRHSPKSPGQTRCEESPFPLLYHAHHRTYTEDLPFWLDLARQRGDPILELGCGTGRVLIPLAEAGHSVYGLDHDPNALAILDQGIPPAIAARVHTILVDLTDFHLGLHFSLILLPCNTFSTLEPGRRQSALVCIHQHLAPDGLFAVSIPNPDLLARPGSSDQAKIESIFPHPQNGNPVQVSCDWERTDTHLTLNWHYDHLLPDGRVDRLTASTRHQLTAATEYLDELEAAGFSITATYGNFDYSSYTPGSPNLIIVVKKL